jgi:hypothetical protein
VERCGLLKNGCACRERKLMLNVGKGHHVHGGVPHCPAAVVHSMEAEP